MEIEISSALKLLHTFLFILHGIKCRARHLKSRPQPHFCVSLRGHHRGDAIKWIWESTVFSSSQSKAAPSDSLLEQCWHKLTTHPGVQPCRVHANHHKHCCRHARTLMLLCPRVALLWEMLHSKPEGLGCLRVKKRANKEVTRMNQLPNRAAGTSRSHLGRNASRICEPFLGLHFSFFICYLSNLSFILSLRNLSA